MSLSSTVFTTAFIAERSSDDGVGSGGSSRRRMSSANGSGMTQSPHGSSGLPCSSLSSRCGSSATRRDGGVGARRERADRDAVERRHLLDERRERLGAAAHHRLVGKEKRRVLDVVVELERRARLEAEQLEARLGGGALDLLSSSAAEKTTRSPP
jgi:hypothetical protein